MGQKEWSPETLLDVFGDRIARATLVVASEQPVAVKDLATELDVSPPTIYRRIDSLVEANLLQEHRRFDCGGHPHSEYETVLDEVTFEVDDDGYTVDIQVRQELADDVDPSWSALGSDRRGDRTPASPHATVDERSDAS